MKSSNFLKTSRTSIVALLFLFVWSPLFVFGSFHQSALQEFHQVFNARNGDLSYTINMISGGLKRGFTPVSSNVLSKKMMFRKRDSNSPNQSGNTTTSTTTTTTTINANTTTGPLDENGVPANFTVDQAYFSPNVTEANELLKKSLSVKDYIHQHRQTFIETCANVLNEQSTDFQNNQTFGWFHFKQVNDKKKVIDPLIVTVNVACYEVTNYDPSGLNPGQPITNYTQSAIESLHWFQIDARKDAELLKQAFSSDNSANKSNMTTTTTTLTPEEKGPVSTTTTPVTNTTSTGTGSSKKKVSSFQSSTTTTVDTFLTGVKTKKEKGSQDASKD